MGLDLDKSKLGLIAKAFEIISKEISYGGLAKALLGVALEHSGAVRGAVLLSEGSELLAMADACLPREKAQVFASVPPLSEFRLPADLVKRVLAGQEVVVRRDSWKNSGFIDVAGCHRARDIEVLCLALVHQKRTTGLIYLELENDRFTQECVLVMSILASHAAVVFDSAQLFEALRETNLWMMKGQQIGRMGSYRWNTRTLLSRASRECYRMFDIDLDINPVPFEVFLDRIHPDDLPTLNLALAEAIENKTSFQHDYRVVHRDGTILYVIAVGQFDPSPSGELELEGIISDITDQRAADQTLTEVRAELARAMRLASLGELAGSIVHEINQPLTGITASAEACLRWIGRTPADLGEARNSALRIIEQARRVSNVVAGLRSLARETPLDFVSVHLNEIIEEILLLSKRDLERGRISLQTELAASMPDIEADRVQLQQVILNLVRNAIDAMADIQGRDRTLTVSTRLSAGQAVVTVSDTGMGINPAGVGRLFEALFTTKEDGLGLGLSISRKIIGAHGGRLWLEQNTTFGATFTFALPLR